VSPRAGSGNDPDSKPKVNRTPGMYPIGDEFVRTIALVSLIRSPRQALATARGARTAGRIGRITVADRRHW